MVVVNSSNYATSHEILQIILNHLESIMPRGLKPDLDLSFVDMGLDSLLLASLELHLRQRFEIGVGFLAKHKSPRECAQDLTSVRLKSGSEVSRAPPLNNSRFPLSHAQKRLIFSASRRTPLECLQIRVADLNTRRLADAWALVASRHTVLRTRLSLTDQQICASPPQIGVGVEEQPASLANPLIIQVTSDSCIRFNYHHALIDGTSLNLLMCELSDAYKDLESVARRPAPAQYVEYCMFEADHFRETSKHWVETVEYWVGELRGLEQSALFDGAAAPGKSSAVEWQVDHQVSRGLRQMAARHQLTLFNLMSGLVRLLFYKLYDLGDLVVAFPVEQRLSSDYQNTIGLFLNPNFCRFNLDPDLAFLTFVKQVVQKTDTALEHGHMPFNVLLNELQARGVVQSEKQLLNLVLVDDKQTCTRSWAQVEVVHHAVHYPQVWYIQHFDDNTERLCLRIEFDESVFAASAINDQLRLFEVISAKILSQPEVAIKTVSLVDGPIEGPELAEAADFLHTILERMNATAPDKVVLVAENKQVCAQDMLSLIWLAAHNLRSVVGDARKQHVVALMLPRSVDLIISLMGAWLNGYVVVPLNPNRTNDYLLRSLPKDAFLVSDRVVDSLLQTIPMHVLLETAQVKPSRHLPEFRPRDLCYFTFTSGSTGEPKLVMSERCGLSNLLANYTREFSYNEHSVVYQVVNPAFDIFLADLVASLGNGCQLVLAKHEVPSINEIDKYRITHAYIMPAYLMRLHSDEDMTALSRLKVLMFGGESISRSFVQRALAFRVPMVQLFGFTEHAVYTNYQWICSLADCSFVGKPFKGTKVIVVDSNGLPRPHGFEGNLASIGVGVCRGYFESKTSLELGTVDTHQAFFSGDLCQAQRHSDRIEYLGRRDQVVKINGQKVYLNQVDQMLSQISGVKQAVTTSSIAANGQRQLVCFVTADGPVHQLQRELAARWPNWTVPLVLRKVVQLPLTSNGKIDKRSLGLDDDSNESPQRTKVSDEDDRISEVLREFLGESYRPDDDFLGTGIDSIQLLQVVQALDERLGIELDVRNAFSCRNAREWLRTKKLSQKPVQRDHAQEGAATWNQEHVWLLKELESDSTDSYRIKLELKFVESIDWTRLLEAAGRILEEHESLRARVTVDGGYLKQSIMQHRNNWFELSQDLSVSLTLEQDYIVRVELDHSNVDGHSLRLIVEMLAKYYRNPRASPRPAAFSSVMYAESQRTQAFDTQLEYFRSQLTDSLNDCLPTELPRLRNTPKLAGHERMSFALDSFSDCRLPLFYLTLAVYLKQLAGETKRDRLTIGIPFANRTAANATAVGYFANELPVCFDLSNRNNIELTEYIRTKIQKTLANSEIPFALLVRRLQPVRHYSANPIYQRSFSFEEFAVQAVDGLFSVRQIDSVNCKHDQTWFVHRAENTLHVHVEYNSHLFSQHRIRQSLAEFGYMLQEFVVADKSLAGMPSRNTENHQCKLTTKLLQFYREELGSAQEVTGSSNFFELGGHSLNAVRLASRIRAELGLNCTTRQIFENQTADQLAHVLGRQNDDSDLYEVSGLQATVLRIMKDEKTTRLQDQYCNKFVVKVPPNTDQVMRLLFQVISQQDALRTRFIIKDGKFMAQVLSPHNIPHRLPYIVRSEDFAMDTIRIDFKKPNQLCFRLSHLVSDGHSIRILMSYLKPSPKSQALFPSADFNSMFNERCTADEENSINFWAPLLQKPFSSLFKDNHVQTPTKSSFCTMTVGKLDFLKELKHEKISPNALLLHKLASTMEHWQTEDDQSEDVRIGIVKDMRSAFINTDFTQTIGFFSQTLPVPCKSRSLTQLNTLLFEIYEHCFVSYELLLDVSKQATLFEVMLVVDFEEDNEVDVTTEDIVHGKFPLTFHVKVSPKDIRIELVYWSEVWTSQTALSMLHTFAQLIDSQQLQPAKTSFPHSPSYLDPIQQIHLVGQQHPNSVAIQTRRTSMTYFELCQKIKSMSRVIVNKMVSLDQCPLRDSVVMVIGRQCARTIAVCLAVMNAGAAYLPIDDSFSSAARIKQIYKDTRTKVVVSVENTLDLPNWICFDELWAAGSGLVTNLEQVQDGLLEPTTSTPSAETSTSLAYVIYTSGTSGPQKSVQIERRSLWNTLQDATQFFDVTSDDCIYQFTNLCFDNSVLEVFVALTNGARLFLKEEEFDARRFGEDVHNYRLTHAFLYPGIVGTFTNNELEVLCQLKCWIVGAEKLSKSLLDRTLHLGVNVIQNYGPTEVTCYALRRRMQKEDNPQNLGRPVPGLKVRLSTRAVPPMSAPRELLISGVGLMRGYVGDDVGQRFMQIEGERFYKTGDLCRCTREGDIVFVGRTDSIVKVRGYRVDLSEVEEVILRHSCINQVKVLANTESISAYVVYNQLVTSDQLRQHCILLLPRYAVPNLFRRVDRLPLTENNKVDTRALLALGATEPVRPSAQMSREEGELMDLWSQMFERPVSVDESFFEIGGNSLSAQRMLNEVEARRGTRFTIADLMASPTIREFGWRMATAKSRPVLKVDTASGLVPLSYQQEQMIFLEEVSTPGEYNLQLVQFFNKQLDCQRLLDSLQALVDNNDILRTRFREIDGNFYQEVGSNLLERPTVEQVTDFELKQLIRDRSTRRLDLFESSPLSVCFFEVDRERYCLFVMMHHSICDATTIMLMEDQVSKIYNGLDVSLPTTPTYADWSIQQRSAESVAKFNRLAEELHRGLSTVTDPIQLHQRFSSSGQIRLLTTVIEVPQHLGSTSFAWFCTKLAQVFTTKFGQKTLVVGAPVQNRNRETSELLGNFLNNIVLPLVFDRELAFEENLKTNQKSIAESMRFAELPFSFVTNRQRLKRAPLYDLYVNFRYCLESESTLRVAEKCESIPTDDYVPLKCHHLLEIDVDELDPQRLRVIWRSKCGEPIVEQLSDELRHACAHDPTTSNVRATIRHAFRKTLGSSVAFGDADDYFLLGGTSLSFLRLHRILKNKFNIDDVDATAFLTSCTVNDIHDKIANVSVKTRKAFIKLVVCGPDDLFVFFPTLFGGLVAYQHVFRELQRQHPGASIADVEIPEPQAFSCVNELASQCALQLRSVVAEHRLNIDSVHFVGASFGALLAYETLRQLIKFFPGFTSLISIDGIANSNQVNQHVTLEEHREQTHRALLKFDLQPETRARIVQDSWHLLQISVRHSVQDKEWPRFHLFLLMIAGQSVTGEYGWPRSGGMRRLLRIDGDHLSMMNDQRSASLVERVLEEICRAKNLKRQ